VQPSSVLRWDDLDQISADLGPTVVTIGNFDGVHRGHHAVLDAVVQISHDRGLTSVAITFEPHPVAFLFPERAPQPLTTVADKVELLGAIGVDAVLVQAFTAELARMSPREYVEQVLVGALQAKVVVVGGDMRFGHRNSGDVGTLRELGDELGFEVHVIADLGRAGEARRWSSTWVRELVAAGDVASADQVLGRPHRVTGKVVHGDHRGRELGYPTANLAPDIVEAIPADGVYAGWLVVRRSGERWPAAISIGTNPTFDGTSRRVEAYVLDQTGLDLYGLSIALEFVQRLRPMLKFDGIEALVAQMDLDVAACRDVLGLRAPA
jgi:riboflavin kinase/FMN adenylyltransferase